MKIEISTVINGRQTEAGVKPRPPKKTCRCRTYNEVLARIRNLSGKNSANRVATLLRRNRQLREEIYA